MDAENRDYPFLSREDITGDAFSGPLSFPNLSFPLRFMARNRSATASTVLAYLWL